MVSALILAAGHSRRMGANKLLLPLRGKPVIALITEALLASPLDHVWIVVGSHSDAVREALSRYPVQFALNPDPDSDMLASVRCGLRAQPAEVEACLIVLGDQPLISPAITAPLLDAFRRTAAPIIQPSWQGKPGHPLLIARSCWNEILTGSFEEGLRGWLLSQFSQAVQIPIDYPGILEDMDTPRDYQRIAAAWDTP